MKLIQNQDLNKLKQLYYKNRLSMIIENSFQTHKEKAFINYFGTIYDSPNLHSTNNCKTKYVDISRELPDHTLKPC